MSKASAILVCPTVPLRHLPAGEVDIIRRFLFQHIKGMDSRHDKRWRRLWGGIWNAEAGEGFQLYRVEERGGPFHRLHRVVLNRLFDSQERYRNVDVLHDYLKLACYFVTWGESIHGNPIPVPRSTNFDECSEDDLKEFHQRLVEVLHEPWLQRKFWPHLSSAQRQEMVDTILRGDPEQQH